MSRKTSAQASGRSPTSTTADDITPVLAYKGPKLWELWYIPYYGLRRIFISSAVLLGVPWESPLVFTIVKTLEINESGVLLYGVQGAHIDQTATSN